MVRIYLALLVSVSFSACTKAQISEELRESITIQTPIYVVQYSETKEQPLSLTYLSTNRPKNVDRGSMNFFTDDDIHTSNNADYYKNVWDKGHLAPAATFSDSMENLRITFSYLNCALQNQYLNRGEWRLLEQEERVWDDTEDLEVTIDLEFSDSILPTGATIPSRFIKHIKFIDTDVYKCYDFPNEKPTKDWEEYQVQHNHS
jgi:DNA/RNA endonuclease G (NUC1)